MKEFLSGMATGYALAVEDLRAAVETGAVHKNCREAIEVLESWAMDAADRWMEDGGETGQK